MAKTMERTDIRGFSEPDEVRPFEKGKVELINVAGRMVGRATFEPGWKWSTCVGPIAKTARCQAAHFGYQVSGTMHIVSSDGEYDIHAGDFFSLPPDHDGWVVGDETVVVIDYQGMADYARPKGEAKREGRRH